MDLDLRKIRYFVVLAEELNYRRAAERLAARRQPTDQYDGALDTIDDHIGAAR